ncbi:MAG: putative colanic acid biosynthesis acetyltransferase [Syntrophobacteraceae bacterium]
MAVQELNIRNNRGRREYPLNVMRRRVLWEVCRPAFRYSPRPAFGWRNMLLSLFGAQIGKHVHIYNSATIYMPWNLTIGDWSAIGEWVLVYNLGHTVMGSKTTISHRAHVCAGTHDYEDPDLPLVRERIEIGDQAWICADAFVGPGIKIGEGAIVGARAVAVKDIEPWAIVVGNPARQIGTRSLSRGEKPTYGTA